MSCKEIYTIDQEGLKNIRQKEYTEIIPIELCNKFNEFVSNNYPWVPVTAYRIDWKKVSSGCKRLAWYEANDEEIRNFVCATCLSKFKEVCMVYSCSEPGLLISLDFACYNLWSLTYHTAGTIFMVGVKRNGYGVAELVDNCFIEIDCSDWLTAPC